MGNGKFDPFRSRFKRIVNCGRIEYNNSILSSVSLSTVLTLIHSFMLCLFAFDNIYLSILS